MKLKAQEIKEVRYELTLNREEMVMLKNSLDYVSHRIKDHKKCGHIKLEIIEELRDNLIIFK